MSHGRRSRRRGISRRSFLRGAAAVPALLAAQPLAAAAADDEVSAAAPAAGPFQHGVASGDPLSDRVILWTRVTETVPPAEIPVDYVVATDTGLANVVATGASVAARKQDYTVKVDVTGLAPGTTYYYRFSTSNGQSPIGRTRTLPVGHVERLRIAVVSCASLAHGWFNAYRLVAKRADLDLVVHLGDYIYEHGDGEYGDLRGYEPPGEIVSLVDYRTRHNQYKRDPDLQALHRQHPLVSVWDDHEIADNAWRGGAENHDPATEGAYGARVAAAVRAYYEWMPIRRVAPNRRKIYRSLQLGDLVELFMLEERLTARAQPVDPNVSDTPPLFTQEDGFADPTRRMLSGVQTNWLLQGMRGSTARWKLIGQGVMLAPARVAIAPGGDDLFFNPDQWDGYKPARDRLLGAIAGPGAHEPVQNAVVLTGDIHSSWAADLPRDPYGDRYDESTGAGSLAVEFVGTSVTSPGFDDLAGYTADGLRSLNPHLKYVDLEQRGYLLLDITPARVSGEWWYVDTVATRGGGQAFGTALQTAHLANHLEPGTQSAPRPGAPPLAP